MYFVIYIRVWMSRQGLKSGAAATFPRLTTHGLRRFNATVMPVARSDGALSSALQRSMLRAVPAPVDRANAADWIEAALTHPISRVATVVYHSIGWQYLSNADRARVKSVMAVGGRAATPDSPFAA
jgi:uncharacterized protein DUF2332